MAFILTPELPTAIDKPIRWGGMHGAALGLAIAEAARQHEGVICVAISNPRQLQILEQELRFFLADSQDEIGVHVFPDWETLAYDIFSPHQEIISSRLRLLANLPNLKRGIIITATNDLLQRLPPVDYVLGHSFSLSIGERIDIEALRHRLQYVGYHAVNQVLTQGEFAVRGGIVDVFPMGTHSPFRLDLFDDEIETIRFFDPDTQKSIRETDQIELLPAREVPLTEDGIRHFRQAFRAVFEGDPSRQLIYEEVSNGIAPPGIEYYLPLFFSHTASLFDYLPTDSVVVLEGGHQDYVSTTLADIKSRYLARNTDPDRQILPPTHLFQTQEEYSQNLKQHRVVTHFTSTRKNVNWSAPSLPPKDYPVDSKSERPYQALADHLQKQKAPTLLAVETAGRREALEGTLREYNIELEHVATWHEFVNQTTQYGITVAPLERSMRLGNQVLELITENQLYGDRVFQRRQRQNKGASQDPEAIIRSLAELQLGAPVVHIDHGVGRYQGLQLLTLADFEEEFLTIEYQGNDKLYVPIQSLNLISRFVGGDPELAPIHKLGSPQWERAKAKAREKSYDVAAELLDIEAARNARKGFAFKIPKRAYRDFCDKFPFEETPDQSRAIDEVLADLAKPDPMDRLVCGDVGFGKTEVALRAAFVAVYNKKQVVILVPTTLLAQQHYESFQDRFADTAISVEMLSRFTANKEATSLVKRFKEGYPDIVIGTHRLIQKDIQFKRLGLLIIDEEHRFGVRQKETLKKLRKQVDILTLTATPIPRTLNMTMSGLREISIIATPPEHRLAIKTFVLDKNDAIVREAALREIHRGGQMYYVHNEVKTIQRVAEDLAELIPEAKVAFAHGQMSELQLEHVMRDFYHQKFNILVATTIIESGIDVPSANTIVLNRADKFGLAQMHQLRGRVGRSHHQAFAYLMIPSRKSITNDARKRLDAIEQLEDLGAGFALASHDLEIRGAGELLGETQSGLIDDIGFTLYVDYLERAIKAIKQNIDHPDIEAVAEPIPQTEVAMGAPALLPHDFLPDVHLRLVMYKRIASAADLDELKELEIETIDRFGLLPEPAKYLFRSTVIKLKASPLGIKKIDMDEDGGTIEFVHEPPIDISEIIALVQQNPSRYRLSGPHQLTINQEFETVEPRFMLVEQLIRTFQAGID